MNSNPRVRNPHPHWRELPNFLFLTKKSAVPEQMKRPRHNSQEQMQRPRRSTRIAASVNESINQPPDRPNGMFDMLPNDAIKRIWEAVERARPCVGHTFSLVWSLIKCWEGDVRVFSFEFSRLGGEPLDEYEQEYHRLQQIVEHYDESDGKIIAFPMDVSDGTAAGSQFFSAKIQERDLQIKDFTKLARYCTQEFAFKMNFRVESELFEHGTWQDVDLGADREGPVNGGFNDEENEECEECDVEPPDEENDEQEVRNPEMTFVICTKVDYTGGNLHQLNHHIRSALD